MPSDARSPPPLLPLLLLLLVAGAGASESDHKYKAYDPVTLWVNKVGPYNNPQETYNYYSLPFCQPSENPAHKWGGLGEVLGGNELIDSQIEMKFQRNVDKGSVCTLELDAAKVKHFTDAIVNSYWLEFFIGFVGETDKNNENKHFLFTHKNIVIRYNNSQIIHVNLTQESPKLLEAGKTLDMTYSVKWAPTDVTFARRFDVYLDHPFFEHQIHWFSIFNSFMMVIFLTGLVSMILMRTLRNDYAKYAREDDDLETLERDVSEESGWKLVHGDVFRPPQNLVLLSALVGTGAQLAMLVLLVIVLAIVGMLYIGRGAIVTTFIVCYALTSFISGYVSGGLYSRNGGKSWIRSMILTASLFPFMCFGIGFLLNTIAIFYGSLAAIPFGTMVVVFILWAFISFPLALLGTVVGRNWSGSPNNPCRVKTIPRPIPEKKWYLTPSVVSLMGGLLPFGSIFIEMYFVFTSFWNYKVYYVYGFMLLVFLILIIVTYKAYDPVTLWVNKVGPYNNPQETYNYYSLPFCQPSENPAHKWGGLGEVLGGNELIDSQIEMKFQRNVDKGSVCTLELDAAKVKHFTDAIVNSYWLEFFIGFVGETDKNNENKHFLFTHKNIVIRYNNSQIIHVNLTQESPKLLEAGKTLDMTYSVKWAPTDVTFARRFDVYLDHPFFEHQIHWFSIFNSFMMVIFLTGLVSMILMRTLRNDYAKYAREDDDLETLERDVSEESGWKLVHGDVFRPPQNLVLLSALVGTGAQLAMLVLLVIVLAIVGMLYIGRGAIVTTFIVCYALTSFISGYVSGGLYSRNGGKSWIRSMILTASLFPFMCFGIGFLLNTIAIFYGSLAAIPFGTMVVVFILWAFISFPLALLGTVVGRNWSGSPNNPCRVKTIPRPIPEKKWYLTPSVVSLMGGLLPFGSIFIEMYFVFTSFWNYKVYYVYGFMLLVFLILIIVTVCVTIVGTYFLLNAENYHWQWTSFFSAASTAVYVYLYSIYYYNVKTKMSGFFQTSFYFGYTLMFCLGLGILCGAVGYLGSTLFVRRIYRNIKCD
ncbi:putative Transmembrane 9 superfamily member 1 [Cocos nucifera]|nr:putative Transmembrane 9 superfamily member 1 [Cocos nucifera]